MENTMNNIDLDFDDELDIDLDNEDDVLDQLNLDEIKDESNQDSGSESKTVLDYSDLHTGNEPVQASILEIDDIFNDSISDYESFDQSAWNKKHGYKIPHFPFMEKMLEGLDEGMYLFAAESNCGKTAIMTNIMFDACTYPENKLFGLYYSLDDNKNLVIPRLIGMIENIPISVGAKPARYHDQIDMMTSDDPRREQYKKFLEKRENGINKLKNYHNCFKIMDTNDIQYAEDIEKHMEKTIVQIRATLGDDYNIIVAIDALDDIRFQTARFGTETERHIKIAKTVKDWSTKFHIPIFGSRHLNKLRMDRRPTLDDLKDTSEYVYEASMVFLLYNEVGKKKQAASIYFTAAGQNNVEENMREKKPVIEIDWAKNKVSSYKGKSYCYFIPEFSKAIEVSEQDKTRFDSLTY